MHVYLILDDEEIPITYVQIVTNSDDIIPASEKMRLILETKYGGLVDMTSCMYMYCHELGKDKKEALGLGFIIAS